LFDPLKKLRDIAHRRTNRAKKSFFDVARDTGGAFFAF
jgi:hypothetical protein